LQGEQIFELVCDIDFRDCDEDVANHCELIDA
jgi:hypothetical protein